MSNIQVNNLIKCYEFNKRKIVANNDISLSVFSGSLIWIYGNSGSGKSTFLNSITGIDSIDSGTVSYDSFNIISAKSREKEEFRLQKCGLIFQFFELIKTQNSYANASIILKLLGKRESEISKKMDYLFDLFSVSNLKNKKPNQLSGGEKQRIAIIRALSNDPLYFFADEITASLDVDMSNFVYSTLRKYLKSKNGIGVFISHDMAIKSYVDEVYEMNGGVLYRREI